jgi:hypothetical protein
MAKSNPVDETRIADPVEPAKPQPRANVKKARRTAKAQKRQPRRRGAVGGRNGTKPESGKQTKQQTCLDLLGRREGATIEELQEATGRLPSWRGEDEAWSHASVGEARCRTPPLSHSEHGLNAMVQDSTCVLAEHSGRTTQPAEADLPQGKATGGAGSDMELSRTLGALPALSPAELRSEWRRLYRSQPPRLSRDLLIRAIAYRIQELRYGGLSKATRRRLAALVNAPQSEGDILPKPAQRISRGAQLVREWNGRTHTVTVKEEGFTYAGRSYRSLTAIAREITGAHWSGPRFFGLARRSISQRLTPSPAGTGPERGVSDA